MWNWEVQLCNISRRIGRSNDAELGRATVQSWQVTWDVPLCRIGRRIGGCNGVEMGGAKGQNRQDGG
jgi:hypothetical protein